MIITSKENETIKHIKKLKEKKYRDEYGEYIIEGVRLVNEAVIEKASIKNLIICKDYLGDEKIESFNRRNYICNCSYF